MAGGVQKGEQEQRVIVERGVALVFLFRVIAVIEKESGKGEQSAGKKLPGTRKECAGLCEGGRWGSHESGAGDIRSSGHHKQSAGSFAAGLPSRGNEAFHGERGQQKNRKHRTPDHPTHRHVRESNGSRTQKIIQSKIADRLDHSGKDKPECEDQGNAVMRATEANQRVRCIAEAEERATHFEVQVVAWRAKDVRLPGIVNDEEV